MVPPEEPPAPEESTSPSEDEDDVEEFQAEVEDDEDDEEPEPEEDDELIDEDPEPEPAPKKKRTRAKKRKTTVATAGKKKRPTLDDIPRLEIKALHDNGCQEVSLNIKRQAPNGRWSAVRGAILMPPYALFELQEAVQSIAGGGTFIYEVVDPNTKTLLLDRWREIYDGRPRAVPDKLTLMFNTDTGRLQPVDRSHAMAGIFEPGGPAAQPVGAMGGVPGMPMQQPMQMGAMPSMGGMPMQSPMGFASPQQQLQQMALQQGPQPQRDARGQLLPPPQGLLPAWMKAYSPEVQWGHVMEERMRKLEGQVQTGQLGGQGGMAGHWIAREIREGGELKSQLSAAQQTLANIERATQEKIEALRKELDAELRVERERRERAEREAERERADARYAELAARLEAQKDAKPAIDWSALAAIAAPLAGVLSAKQAAEAETRKAERDAETKMMLAMIAPKKDDNGMVPMLTALAPLLVPVLTKWMDTSGPQAQAELMGIEHEQRMMSLKMMADMLGQMAPEAPPAWQPIVENMITAFGTHMMQRAQHQTRQLGGGRTQGLPQGAPQPVPAAPPQPAGPTPLEELLRHFEQNDPEAGADVRDIYQRLPAQFGFHTHEWATILFNIHAKLEVREMAEVIKDHLIACERFQTMPAPLASVFDDPRGALMTVLGPLPITEKDPQYVQELVTAVEQQLRDSDDTANQAQVVDVEPGHTVPTGTVVGGGGVVTPAPVEATGT